MIKNNIGYILIFIGFGLFTRTLLVNLDFPLVTSLIIMSGLGLLVYGLMILIDLKKDEEEKN